MFSTSESIFTLLAASVQNKSWEHSSGSREEVLARIEEASLWLEGSSLFSLLVSKAPAATASSLRAARPVTWVRTLLPVTWVRTLLPVTWVRTLWRQVGFSTH